MDDTVKMVLVIQAGFIEINQEQILQISWIRFEFGNLRDFQLSSSRKLVPQQCLAGSVIVVFLCHMKEPPIKDKGFHPSYKAPIAVKLHVYMQQRKNKK